MALKKIQHCVLPKPTSDVSRKQRPSMSKNAFRNIEEIKQLFACNNKPDCNDTSLFHRTSVCPAMNSSFFFSFKLLTYYRHIPHPEV